MKVQASEVIGPVGILEASSPVTQQQYSAIRAAAPEAQELQLSEGFINFATLRPRIGLSERALREAIRRGDIPSIRFPGCRRVLFDWPAVKLALKRLERTRQPA